MAFEKGFYKKNGLDMTIMAGGPDRPAETYLKSGKTDFAVLWFSTAIRQCAAGAGLVNIGQIIPKSSMMLVSKKTSGIKTPSDMHGKKIGVWGGDFAIPAQAFFNKHGLEVRLVPQSYTVNLFLRGGVDVASAMWFNEYHTILNSGVDSQELEIFFLKDYGVCLPEDGLYCLESNLRKDPGMAASFVKASAEGWEYAFSHQDETLGIVMKYMKDSRLPANLMHQKWMLSRLKELVMPKGSIRMSVELDKADFEAAVDTMKKQGVITSAPDYKSFTGGDNEAD